MSSFRSKEVILACLRIVAGGVFLYAGWISVRTPLEFADSVAGYRLLPRVAIALVALVLPAVEIVVGALLIAGRPRRAPALAGLILTLVFAAALTSAIARGLTIDCGCFGHGTPSRFKMWLALGRDALLGGALLVIYRREIRRKILEDNKGNEAWAQGVENPLQ